MDLFCKENIMNDNEKDAPSKQQQQQQEEQEQQQQQQHISNSSTTTSPCSNSSSSVYIYSLSSSSSSSLSSSSSSSSSASLTLSILSLASSGYCSQHSSSASQGSVPNSSSSYTRHPFDESDSTDTWSHNSLDVYDAELTVVDGMQSVDQQDIDPEPNEKLLTQQQQQQRRQQETQQLRQQQQQLHLKLQQQCPNANFSRPSECFSSATEDPTFRTDRCLENVLKMEEKRQLICWYFKTVQKDITPQMRKIVVEWMMEVCAEEACQEEVVLLAINYLDRFLSLKSVRKANLQILAASCLLLASKLREPSCRALSADLLVFYTDNSICKSDLIKWELFVLSRLGWDLSSVTPLDFLELLLIRLPIRNTKCLDLNVDKVRQHAQAFISLAAKEHCFLLYSASTIAASSIAAAMSGLNWHQRTGKPLQYLLNILTDLTSIAQDFLRECMMKMEDIFEEHSRNLQPYLMSMNAAQQAQQQQQHHLHLHQIVLPDLTQTCKMQANAQKDVQDIKF